MHVFALIVYAVSMFACLGLSAYGFHRIDCVPNVWNGDVQWTKNFSTDAYVIVLLFAACWCPVINTMLALIMGLHILAHRAR
jgi:hypothetical protein